MVTTLLASTRSWTAFLAATAGYLMVSPVLTWHASAITPSPVPTPSAPQDLHYVSPTRMYLATHPAGATLVSDLVHPDAALAQLIPSSAGMLRHALLTGLVATPLLMIAAAIALSALLRVPKASSASLIHHVSLLPVLAGLADMAQNALFAFMLASGNAALAPVLVMINSASWTLFYVALVSVTVAAAVFVPTIGRDGRQRVPKAEAKRNGADKKEE